MLRVATIFRVLSTIQLQHAGYFRLKVKGCRVEEGRFYEQNRAERSSERAWLLMRLCRCHPRGGNGVCWVGPLFDTHQTPLKWSNETSCDNQLTTRRSFNYTHAMERERERETERERRVGGGCPNINTLRTIPGTRIRDKKQWK